MARTSFKNLHCPVAQFAEALGDKWCLLIIRDAFMGINTFSGFERDLGVAKNVLTERLNHLVEHDILIKRQTRPKVNRFTYELTNKGLALQPIANEMTKWSQKWVPGMTPHTRPKIQRDAS